MRADALKVLTSRPTTPIPHRNAWPWARRRVLHFRHGCIVSIMVMALSALAPVSLDANTDIKAVADENAKCLRCHGMSTLSYIDPMSGKHLDFSVDAEKFSLSDHGRQTCMTCHKGNFAGLPHQPEGVTDHHSCGDCHTGDKLIQRMRLVGITAQFKKSVHVQEKVAGFDCFSCHNPHESRLEDQRAPEADVVQRDNGVCLRCHQQTMTEVEKHRIIPKASLHLGAVRCLDCHTPRPGSVIHAIEPAERAERNCVACHSRDSILLTKLYKYRLHESEHRAGFINGVVLSDYYVIG
ncbi:MAG TPA: hypothetical protein HPQ00_16530, partial [Magnetococcales bacterium]|nr:hypothetical protein [Magnetococcales bacterium]